MISGMHVRRDWNSWIAEEKSTVYSLCGKRTTMKYAGIPTITMGQPITLPASREHSERPGWCPRCMQLFLEELGESLNGALMHLPVEQAEPLSRVYKNAAVFTAQAVVKYSSIKSLIASSGS